MAETKLEDLRKWFGKGKKGDWVRVGTDGEIKGDCAREPGEGKPKCMPRSKAHSMSKKDRASSARRKRRADPSVDRPGTGNKPIMVKTDKRESVEMNEKTNWKMGDGRPRNGARIQNDRFWNLPRASLEYIRKDAHAAMKANPNGKKAGKYADEVNDAETVLAWRKKNGIRESVEMNEQFVVKYAKNKRGPIYQTKFKTQPEAEKFLAQKRKEGMNGIISKAGKPVSMQKMADLQKESVDEATMADRTVLRAVRIAKDMGGNMTGAVRRIEKMKKGLSDHPKVQAALRLANESLEEKNVPTNPALWAKMKAQAKAKFDVYPSAYANGWAAKKYKAAGGSWKKESVEMPEQKTFWDVREGSCGTMNAQTKKDEKPPFVPTRKVGVKKDRFGNVVKDKNRAKHLAKLAMRGEATRTALDRKITTDRKKMTQTQRDNELGQMAHDIKKGRARDGRPMHPNKLARRAAYRQSQIDRGLRKESVDLDENARVKAALRKIKGASMMDLERTGNEIRAYAKKSGGADKKDFNLAADYVIALGRLTDPTKATRVKQDLTTHVGLLDTDVRDKIKSMLPKGLKI